MAPMWFSLGFLAYFILLRLIDVYQKKAGRECNYDCSKCTCHCAGYHCYCERQKAEEIEK